VTALYYFQLPSLFGMATSSTGWKVCEGRRLLSLHIPEVPRDGSGAESGAERGFRG
jgi:hypothetical protein